MTAISIHIIANQSSYHDDKSTLQCFTHVFCPQLIRNVRSRRRIDSSSIIPHPVKFRFSHLGEIVKMLCQELDIYTCVYIYMMLLIMDVDFLSQFNLGLIALLFTVSFHETFEKKMFFKIFKSWQVCDWLVKGIIMLQFMDLRWPRVFRRSKVGLVAVTCKFDGHLCQFPFAKILVLFVVLIHVNSPVIGPYYYIPCQWFWGGVYWFHTVHLPVCPSVCLSVFL